MQKSIMKALFNGGVIPWERRNTHTPERRELETKIENEKRYFIEKMSLDDCQRFEKLETLYQDAAFDEETDIYTHGFTLGAMLMIEVMANKDEMIG